LTIEINQLNQLPIEALQPLLKESQDQGFEFVDRLLKEYVAGTNRFNRHGEALFGVYSDRQLIAVGGLNRDPYLPGTNTGRVRHVYVLAAWRRRGIGKILVQRIVAEARLHFRRLTLRTLDAQADAFYRAIGFQPSGAIKDASHIMDLAE
jgi:GNAT superfamily N-acetyltransferase